MTAKRQPKPGETCKYVHFPLGSSVGVPCQAKAALGRAKGVYVELELPVKKKGRA